MLKHACLNIDYGLNNLKKHKLYNVNPNVRTKQQIKESKHCLQNTYESSIGMSIPHMKSNDIGL